LIKSDPSGSVPDIILGKVHFYKVPRPPKKPKNSDRRTREYLTSEEVDSLMKAAKKLGRHGHRDSTMILVAFRHGLRVSELISLWSQSISPGHYPLFRKNGISTSHPLWGAELRALRQVQRDYPETPYVFVSERKTPMTASTFSKILTRAAAEAGLSLSVHPHMLRHSTGFKLANEGQDTRSIQHFLGHKNIQHTVRYTEMAPDRFKNFWKD
jgi:type 1 fimbriae regulatory protein FimB/type 1 fimbriae regulatory protein FimE